MRYTHITSLVFLSIVIVAAPLWAQDSTTQKSDFRIGIGVALDLGSAAMTQETQLAGANTNLNGPPVGIPLLYPAAPLTFSIPMRFGHFMIEPEIGIYSYSYDLNGSQDSTGVPTSETEDVSGTSIRAGIGLYYTQQIAGNLSAYIGPRIGIVTNSVEFGSHPPPADTQFEKSATAQLSRTDFFVGVTLGGEYFFSSGFSLGAEAGFEYLSLGNTTITETPVVSGSQGGTTGHSFQTKEAIVARVYF